MIFCTILSVAFAMIYTVLIFHPFSNETLNGICCFVSIVLYTILMYIANESEKKLKSRIKALEDKLNNEEENK